MASPNAGAGDSNGATESSSATALKSSENLLEESERRRLLALVLCIALAVRLLALVPFLDAKPVYDEAYYLSVAEALVEGRGHTNGLSGSEAPAAIRPPLYPAVLAGIRTLGASSVREFRVFQIIPSLVTVFLVFSLCARRFGTRAGFVSALFCALSPSLVHYSHLLWPESLAAMLLALFFWLMDRYDRSESFIDLALAGLVLGVGALNKSVWAYFGVVSGVWLFLRAGTRRRRAGAVALLLLGIAVVVLPWTLRNYRALDKFVLVADQTWWAIAVGSVYPVDDWFLGDPDPEMRSVLMARARRLPEPARDAYWREVSLQLIAERQPGWLLHKLVRTPAALYSLQSGQLRFIENGWIEMRPSAARALIVADVLGHYLTLIPGIIALWVVPGGRLKWLVVLAILFINGVHVLANAFPRYHVALLPLFLLYAGPLLTRSYDRARVHSWQWAGAALTVLAFVLIPLPRSVKYITELWTSL